MGRIGTGEVCDTPETGIGGWRDSSGRFWLAGQVTPGGDIISATPGQMVTAGTVWVLLDQAAEAYLHGWRQNGQSDPSGALVQVERYA